MVNKTEHNIENLIKQQVKQQVIDEGGSSNISQCAKVMLASANFGKANPDDLVNAGIAAEFFFQALHRHYSKGKGKGTDVIMGDYFGAVAIVFSNKIEDSEILKTFCKAIQEATKDKDDEYKEAGRLAKIYGASAWVGAYLAGLTGDALSDFRLMGEKTGLRILRAIDLEGYKQALVKFSKSNDFIKNVGLN